MPAAFAFRTNQFFYINKIMSSARFDPKRIYILGLILLYTAFLIVKMITMFVSSRLPAVITRGRRILTSWRRRSVTRPCHGWRHCCTSGTPGPSRCVGGSCRTSLRRTSAGQRQNSTQSSPTLPVCSSHESHRGFDSRILQPHFQLIVCPYWCQCHLWPYRPQCFDFLWHFSIWF